MNVLRKAVGVTGWTALTGAITYSFWTGQNVVLPIPPTDYIFGNTLIARFNPNNSPVFHDVCLRKVRFENIRPELLDPQNEGKLVQAFCAGVWSGAGESYKPSPPRPTMMMMMLCHRSDFIFFERLRLPTVIPRAQVQRPPNRAPAVVERRACEQLIRRRHRDHRPFPCCI